MFTNILVPLDGSPLAESALPYARALATKVGAKLTLVRAAAVVAEISQAEAYLAELCQSFTQEGFGVETGVPYRGDPAQWIVEEADFRHADVIIMASHDRVGVDRLVHGSVAERVIHSAKAPVMVVKGTAAADVASRISAEQPVVVVPLDSSHLAESALEPATQLAQAIGARIVLFSVVAAQANPLMVPSEVQAAFTDTDYAQMQADARAYLEPVARQLRAQGMTVDAIVRIGEAGLEIASIAQQYSAAVVVMATHGRTGLLRSMLGSVAGAVVHCGNTPVVLVHPSRVPMPV
jgi:nucleotide-binding universal stress UspA family protein